MPVVYVCPNCGRPLSAFYGDSSRGLPTLGKVLDEYAHAGKYVCYCGAELYPDPDLIEVHVIPTQLAERFVDFYEKKKEEGIDNLKEFYKVYSKHSDPKKREMFLKMWRFRRSLVEVIESMRIKKKSKNLKSRLKKD